MVWDVDGCLHRPKNFSTKFRIWMQKRRRGLNARRTPHRFTHGMPPRAQSHSLRHTHTSHPALRRREICGWTSYTKYAWIYNELAILERILPSCRTFIQFKRIKWPFTFCLWVETWVWVLTHYVASSPLNARPKSHRPQLLDPSKLNEIGQWLGESVQSRSNSLSSLRHFPINLARTKYTFYFDVWQGLRSGQNK